MDMNSTASLDLVSIPPSCLLLDTRGVQEVGKRGSRLTTWLIALRDAGLKPGVVHTDKDFAEVTAAAIAFNEKTQGINIICVSGTACVPSISISQ
ncbi:hypothetical protein V1521DRAFT_448931, partial [Lipomyces starkeyi]